MSPSRLIPLLAAFVLSACGKPPTLHGLVKDAWGKPVADATVRLEGQVAPIAADGSGAFMVELSKGQATARLMAGKDGYIQGLAEVTLPSDGDEPLPKVLIELYKEPAQPGFYGFGREDYVHLAAEPIETLGTEVRAFTGLPDIGKDRIPVQQASRFVFSSTLRSSELSRLQLQIHKLEFHERLEIPGVLGEVETRVNLWVAAEAVDFDLKGLPSRDDYLITPREPLPTGVYAFSTQGVLDSKSVAALDKLPKEMRVAYPFEVK